MARVDHQAGRGRRSNAGEETEQPREWLWWMRWFQQQEWIVANQSWGSDAKGNRKNRKHTLLTCATWRGLLLCLSRDTELFEPMLSEFAHLVQAPRNEQHAISTIFKQFHEQRSPQKLKEKLASPRCPRSSVTHSREFLRWPWWFFNLKGWNRYH